MVAFEGLGSGAFTISEEIPGDFNEFEVLCWGDNVPGAPEPRQIAFTRFDANGVGLELTQGEELACRWVNKPVDAKGDPEPTPKPTATPSTKPAPRVNQLPNTGTGPTVAGRDTNATTPVLTLVVGLAVAGLVMVRRRRTA